MAEIEKAEGIQGEVERTKRNFGTIRGWADAEGRGSNEVDDTALQIAAALEENELAALKETFDAFRLSGVPQSFKGCLLAALEIVKRNRGKASASAPASAPEVAGVQAAVRAGLPEPAPELVGGRDFLEVVRKNPNSRW